MDKSYQKALRLEYFTVGYNVIEAIAAIFFGDVANSIALIGFGLDSVAESLSGLVLVWRLRMHGRTSLAEEEKIERKATRFVALTFFLLGAYVLYESLEKLMTGAAPDPSPPGIAIALLSLTVMPILAYEKRKLGRKIKSNALIADSKETLACSFLSAALLLGLMSNYFLGFWQADPLAGFVIVFFLLREGWESWNEDENEDDNSEDEKDD